MADDERRAETEAVARAMHHRVQADYSLASCRSAAREAIEALDRVRDARGDDEGQQGECSQCGRAWPSSRFECPCGAAISYRNPVRSPQDEDHDGRLIELALSAGDWPRSEFGREKMARSLTAVMAHLSVSGTEPDTAKLVEALRYIAGEDVAGYEGHRRPEDVAREALVGLSVDAEKRQEKSK